MKNSPSVLSCIGKTVIMAAKSGQFTTDKTGKGQFLREQRILAEGSCEKDFVSTKSSKCV